MPIVSPLGVTDDTERWGPIAGLVLAKGKRSRKDWKDTFFAGTFGAPLDAAAAGRWAQAFEAVRLAPSAINKQPWRIVMKGNAFHFCQHGGAGNFGRVDLGIAMYHWKAACEALGLPGAWAPAAAETVESLGLPEGATYAMSWVFEE